MPGAIAGVCFEMCEIEPQIPALPESAHKLANYEGPPPLAVAPMLGLSRRPGQAGAAREIHDFSLRFPILSSFQAFEANLPEMAICEQDPLDARHRVADRCSLFQFGGQMGARRLLAAVIAIELALVGDRRAVQPVEQPFLQRAAGEELGPFRPGTHHFLRDRDGPGRCFRSISFTSTSGFRSAGGNWMTANYLGQWLHDANHYRMQLQGDAADNPDQRIADDIKLFIERTLEIGVGLLSAVVTLVSFVIILWGLSAEAPLTLFGRDFSIPGYLVWGALIYSVLGTALAQWIGSPLVNLDFQQQRYEADFRFNLVRVRENAEQIALLKGERAERQRLSERFSHVVENWYAIMSRTKRLTGFTKGFAQAAIVFPFILVVAGLFHRQDRTRRHGAGRTGIRQRADRAVIFRHGLPRAGGMARGGGAARRIRDGDRKRRGAADRTPIRSMSCPRPKARRSTCGSSWCDCRTARLWWRPMTSASAAPSAGCSPAPPAQASRRCFAALPASGHSAPARSRFRRTPR